MSDKVIAVAENGIEVTQAMIDTWCEAYEKGSLPTGYDYDGEIRQGRPKMFDGGTSTVVVRIPSAQKDALGREAQQKGMSMSGYVREILAKRETVAM